jgi:hypothetical protein
MDYEPERPPPAEITGWFRHWFDVDNERDELNADLLGIIQSLLVKPGVVTADLGTAEPRAFWELVELLVCGGATDIRVGSRAAKLRLERSSGVP